jgi:hypothetical protein
MRSMIADLTRVASSTASEFGSKIIFLVKALNSSGDFVKALARVRTCSPLESPLIEVSSLLAIHIADM